MANGTTNFGNDASTGTVGSDGFNGPLNQPVQTVAAAGSNSQANSTALTGPVVIVITASGTTRGVKLPTAATGKMIFIMNAAGTNNKVYPATNGKIGTAATNAVTTLTKSKSNIYIARNTTQWHVVTGA